MIKKIAHLSDIHIRKSPHRNIEYYSVFENLYKSLIDEKPDRIVLSGDIVNDYIDIQGEQLVLLGDFLNNLSQIAPVRVTRGNHDIRRSNLNRIDTVDAVVKTLNNPNIVYYNETNFFDDENVTWAIWKHGDKKVSPWKIKTKNYNKENIIIDIFHNTVNGCINVHGYEFNSPTNINVRDLKGDFSFLGHIHKQQYLNKEKTKAYAGSLIAQAFDEGDDNFHGYILWDIENKSSKLISIENEYSFKNLTVNDFTDFSDIDLEIENPTKYMRIRVIWKTLPYTKSSENEKIVESYLKNKYNNIINITHKEDFVEDKTMDKVESEKLMDINNVEIQHQIFKEYLEKMGVENNIIDEIIKLDTIITERIDVSEFTNIQWDVVRLGGENFMSYKKFDLDWYQKNGIHQIVGKNAEGKTTIFKNLLYTLYNKTPETENRIKFGDYRYINNRLDVNSCYGYAVIEANSEFYGIRRETTIKKNKSGEISGAPTTVQYYKLNNYDDDLTEENCIDNLNDDDKRKTQKIIEKIVGDYDNFMRVVFTTSDTLNRVLSNDMAVFMDSLLYDSGLDIFDKKLQEFKTYLKEIQNNKPRIICDVESSNNKINNIQENIRETTKEIETINKEILEIKNKIKTGNEFIDGIRSKLYEIDPEIFNLDVNTILNNNKAIQTTIDDLNQQKEREELKLVGLAETFDEMRFNQINENINIFKTNISNIRLEESEKKREIMAIEHKIALLNGEIFRMKEDGVKKKGEYENFKNSPICQSCGQKIVGDEHKDHVQKRLNELKNEIISIGDKIKQYQNVDIINYNKEINIINEYIDKKQQEIIDINLEMEKSLNELGVLSNNRNDVMKRQEINNIIQQIPLKIQIEELKIRENEIKIKQFNDSQKHIEENKKNTELINKGKERLEFLNNEFLNKNNLLTNKKFSIESFNEKIVEINNLIDDFKLQEKIDKIHDLYEKCVHRNGIPKQMLSVYVIPKINLELKNLLEELQFNVWLDPIELRPKLTYKNNTNSTIDAISSSGKERTFASLSLKQALVSINKKSKPKLFLLDEVTGKLVDESVQEFMDLINIIKRKVNKLVVVEHTHEIEPDYVLNVSKNSEGISSVVMNENI